MPTIHHRSPASAFEGCPKLASVSCRPPVHLPDVSVPLVMSPIESACELGASAEIGGQTP